MGKKKSIYLANQLGFSEVGKIALNRIVELLESFFTINEPFAVCENAIKEGMEPSRQNIGKLNDDKIKESDIVVALLDGGHTVDDGASSEIGYACGIGKVVYGLRTDNLRMCDGGGKINLQIEYFIKKSGGIVFYSIDAMINDLV